MPLVAAYGRSYRNQESVIRDYMKGKDFILKDISDPYDGKYCSCRDFPDQVVELRYGKYDEKVVMTTASEDQI